MKRFNWQQMQEYWRIHESHWGGIDCGRDPEGLRNACNPTAPAWLNRYYAHFQEVVYQKLFRRLSVPLGRPRALEVGCGSGRWCRFLADHGYETTGIDLQPQLIELNRRRYPSIDFLATSIQDYRLRERFDLVSCVTVLIHIPFEDQDAVLRKIREALKPNGHAIVLESVRSQAPHVFSNSLQGWRMRFERAGFRLLAARRCNYSFFLRALSWAVRRPLSFYREDPLGDPDSTPERLAVLPGRRPLRGLHAAAQGAAVGFDAILETIFVQTNIAFPALDAGFLLEAI
ncbi:MAG: class I SAM-dependent methyltransferase [Candidatus Omnitrophica bacterium]|nr:class I SAM-dependent methyltransferase [Candidatus Omnitrophota bacterium]